MLAKIKDEMRRRIPFNYKYLWHRFRGKLFGFHSHSYSQFGEDMILKSIFRDKTKGFYVDVGAYHPHFISNTHYFYKRGWQGINIDPSPNCMELFRKWRKRDTNLELAVSDIREEKTFFLCDIPSLNTFSKKIVETRESTQSIQFSAKKNILCIPLRSILDEHLPKGRPIDFFSIDAEGFDLNVLKSNDWKKYRPRAIVIEVDMNFKIDQLESDPIVKYLGQLDYKLISFTLANFIFVEYSYTVVR